MGGFGKALVVCFGALVLQVSVVFSLYLFYLFLRLTKLFCFRLLHGGRNPHGYPSTPSASSSISASVSFFPLPILIHRKPSSLSIQPSLITGFEDLFFSYQNLLPLDHFALDDLLGSVLARLVLDLDLVGSCSHFDLRLVCYFFCCGFCCE